VERLDVQRGRIVKIAIIGTRGIPANYGGFETFAEESAARMAAHGHDVTVYCRSHYVAESRRSYRGANLVVLPTLRWKYTDTVAHTAISVLHAAFRRFDAILICNAANAPFAWIPRLFGTAVVVNVDGIERLRRKWNVLGRAYYRACEYLSTRLPDEMVTDALTIQQYYRATYGRESVLIPYGALTEKPETHDQLQALGVSPGEYFLYVSRFEPENNAHVVVAAFERVRSARRLVVVGDAPYSREYIHQLKSTADPRILFPGAIYGAGYRELLANSFCYIHATEVGGTHPALIEAMGMGNLVVANQTPENEEVLGSAGLLYRKNDVTDLTRLLQDVTDCSERYGPFREAAVERAKTLYSWDAVVAQYEQLFASLVRK
jgi:glycosyltransferase involved in cell wall biosynthesis